MNIKKKRARTNFKHSTHAEMVARRNAVLKNPDTLLAMEHCYGEPGILYDINLGGLQQQVRPYLEVTAESFRDFAKNAGETIDDDEANVRFERFEIVRKRQRELRLVVVKEDASAEKPLPVKKKSPAKKLSPAVARRNKKSKMTRKRNARKTFQYDEVGAHYCPQKKRRFDEPRDDDEPDAGSTSSDVSRASSTSVAQKIDWNTDAESCEETKIIHIS